MSYDYLLHGLPWKKHKYIAKVKTGGKNLYRYFYDQAEYQAFLHPEQSSITTPETKNEEKPKQTLSDWFNSVTSAVSNLSETSNSKTTKTKPKTVSNLIESAKDTSINSLKSPSTYARNFVSNILSGSSVGMSVADTVFDIIYDATTKEKSSTTTDSSSKNPSTLSDLKRKDDTNESNDSIQEKINPNYDPYDYAYSNNCSYCTAAYDLQKRGYDVEAAPISETDDATTIDEILSWYDGAEPVTAEEVLEPYYDAYTYVDTETASKAITELLESYGEGARGHFCYYWYGGGGHDVVWEIENSKLVIRDCQSNTVVDIDDYMAYACDYVFFRTDNIEPNDKIVSKVRNRS